MKILITNDDGIFSSGIYALWEVAKEFGSVYVVAPNSQKSATGHSITISKPLFVDKINENLFKLAEEEIKTIEKNNINLSKYNTLIKLYDRAEIINELV